MLVKHWASAFFATPLASFLAASGADSVVVTGASTSGCVRATVVDALQHGYPPTVPREAVGDRNRSAHEANLYDIEAKYGDVVGPGRGADRRVGLRRDGGPGARGLPRCRLETGEGVVIAR